MPTPSPRDPLASKYEAAAQDYFHSLPFEHFPQSTGQSEQRQITLYSFALVSAHRPEMELFNELLVQYPIPGSCKLGQVVPDNMVVVSEKPIIAGLSFDLPLQSARLFWVMDYLSKFTNRKDYDDNRRQYEQALKVPYYLRFHCETKEFNLYRHMGEAYSAISANNCGRYAVPELEMEIGLLDGRLHYWFRGELLPSPTELHREVEERRKEIADAKRRQELARSAQKVARQARKAIRKARDMACRSEFDDQARAAAEQEAARLYAELQQLCDQLGEGK